MDLKKQINQDVYSQELGARLKVACDSFGPRKDLLAQSGISQPSLNRYLNGTHSIGAADLYRIAEVTGVSASWLFTGEGDQADVNPEQYVHYNVVVGVMEYLAENYVLQDIPPKELSNIVSVCCRYVASNPHPDEIEKVVNLMDERLRRIAEAD